ANKNQPSNIWKLLTECALISAADAKQIRQHERKLQNLRIRLHYLSGRREDRLLFDFQNELAAELGYHNTPRKRASEQLMQSYYRSAKNIELMNEILLKEIKQKLTADTTEVITINADFESRNQLLECKNQTLLSQRPAAIFEAFLLLQQHPELQGMGPGLLRKLQHAKHLVNQNFRHSHHNKKRFIEILSQPIGVNHTLRAMNRYGILGRYIPAFGRIIGQMQHDLFHV
ncbi:MAG: bifunctional uridylyltransferase/uridylyl-removing protein, partial [Methylotenera sp.]